MKFGPQKIAILCLTGLIFFLNFKATYREYRIARTINKNKLFEPGYQLADFKNYLKSAQSIGYLTDRDLLSENMDSKYFLFAQYMLAPNVLKINDVNQDLFILDYAAPLAPFDAMERLQLEPVFVNPYGKILARKK